MPRAYVYYTYRDAKGETGRNEISFPVAVDIGVLQAFLSSTALLIDAVTRCQIINAGIGLEINLAAIGGLKTAPIAGSDVEEGAVFTFGTSADSLTRFRIPGFDETFVDDTSRAVDIAATAVDALVDRITAGHTVGLTNVSPSDQYGNDVTSLYSARESFQSSRN